MEGRCCLDGRSVRLSAGCCLIIPIQGSLHVFLGGGYRLRYALAAFLKRIERLIYKYLPISRIGFLTDGLIRFTQPGDLNDPYECLAAFPEMTSDEQLKDLKKWVLDLKAPSLSDSPEARAQKEVEIFRAFSRLDMHYKCDPQFFRTYVMDHAVRTVNGGLGILSLSRRWDSALMWSHYTSTYQGFCVGFDRRHNFFKGCKTEKGMINELTPVSYSSKRIVLRENRYDYDGYEVFLTKSPDWQYEEEERLLATLGFADMVNKLDGCKYLVHLFRVPLDAITELVVGHLASDELKQSINDAAEKLGVASYITRLSDTSFDVERVRLN